MSFSDGIRRRLKKLQQPPTQEMLNNPPSSVGNDIAPPATDRDDIVDDSNYWKCLYKPVMNCLALFFAIMIYGVLTSFLLVGLKILVPGCPSVNGRVCNEQGTCTDGQCVCNPLFSGADCSANQVPGYDVANNILCSGQGFVLSYRAEYIPVECQEVVVDGVRQGGWTSQSCSNFVYSIRSKILQNNGDVSKVPRGYTVPSCICNPGIGGTECGLSNVCPMDENLRICAGHGNTSVGLIANYTNAGVGCQCESLIAFYEPKYMNYWTPDFFDFLNNQYNYYMNQMYCGVVTRVLNVTTGQPMEDFVIAYTIPSNYACHCDAVSRGEICSEGRCPLCPDNGDICCGNGHPLYGMGYRVGSPVSAIDGVLCNIECIDDHQACGNKCFPKNNTISGIDPTIYNAGFCNNPTVCPKRAPIRCADGSCASFPLSYERNCNLGYQYGSIDYGRLDVAIEQFRCPNITNVDLYEICFGNSTYDNNVMGFPSLMGGGVVVDFSDPSYKFRVNFTSPLIYFQFSTNASGVYVENFNGDVQFFDDRVVNGLFDYDLSLRWGEKINHEMTVSTQDNLYYTFTPAPFNFTYLSIAPFDLFRVTNILQRRVFVLSTVASFLNYDPIEDFLDIPNGVLVFYNSSMLEVTPLVEYYWLNPSTGDIISNEICLSNPSPYSWYVDIFAQSIRSLDSQFYICVDLLTGMPITQNTPCIYDLSELLFVLPGVFYRWDTSIYGLAETKEIFFIDDVDYYQLPTSEDLPYYIDISFQTSLNFNSDETQITSLFVLLSGFVFLTKDQGIGFPCSCDIPSTLTNQTVLNELWYSDTNTRSIDSNIEVGDFIVYPSFITGDRVLRRGIVGSFNDASETISVVRDNITEIVYFKESRKISNYEYLAGIPDGVGDDFLLNPFKCPSGKYTDAELNIDISETSCNCTFVSNGIFETGNGVDYNCTCIDDFITATRFGCQCSLSDCICGYPANTDFVNLLVLTVQNLITSGCECLVYSGYQAGVPDSQGDLEASEYFQRAEFIDAMEYQFFFYPENIVDYIVVDFDECDGTEEFSIKGGSVYFQSDSYVDISFLTTNQGSPVGNWVPACQYYLLLIYDPSLVFTNLTIEATSPHPMVNVTLSFMKYGYSIVEIQESTGRFVDVVASSNDDSADYVLWLGSPGWNSSGTLHENPVTIQFGFTFNSYMTNYLVIFKSAGRKSGNVILPLRVYIQGSNDLEFWYGIDSFQIYIDPEWDADPYSDNRYQIHQYVPILNQTYSNYRLMSTSFPLDILHVDFFTNVTCKCIWQNADTVDPINDTNFGMAIQLQSLEGLVNITAQVELYKKLMSNFKTHEGCVYQNNCTLMDESATNNGICNDVIYQASLLGIKDDVIQEIVVYYSPNNFSASTENFTYEGFIVTAEVNITGFSSVQFYVSLLDVMDSVEQYEYYQTTGGSLPLVSPITGLYIFYFNPIDLVIEGMGDINNIWRWVENEMEVTYTETSTLYGNLIVTGAACEAGTDGVDCGHSNRIDVLSPQQSCDPFNPYTAYNTLFNQSINLYYRSLIISRLKSITTPWYGEIQRLTFELSRPSIHPIFCGGEVCPKEVPFKCLNGRCVRRKRDCENTWTCPGNGCIELTNSSDFGAYRCACRPGTSGEDCGYEETRAATPEIPIDQPRVPPSEEAMCGGPPPIRIKPPILNKKAFYTTEELIIINQTPKGSCAPRSKKDTGFVCTLPTFAPWGQVVLRIAKVLLSPLLPNVYETIYTTCPFCRKGYYGECLMRPDDVASENVFSGEPTFKVYTNPFTGQLETFTWANPFVYDDMPYRCANAKCVANRDECTLSEAQFPLCNLRGRCMADGHCDCSATFATFLINNDFSETIRYPYEWDHRHNTTNPVAWTLNYNWRLYALNQCAARDCSYGKCKVPMGCNTGTYELGFTDKEILCPNNGLCAKNSYACYGNVNLTSPRVCSGNGIKRVKDVTGEEYCACGTPVSTLLNIEDITSIVQLTPNGWGGPNCNQPYANKNTPLYWSPWDYKNNIPYRSKITGEVLPGIWVKGDIIMGPRPEDKLIWDKCCQGYSRLELCPFVPCNTPPTISCLSPQACLVYDPTAPLLYECNGHGVARGDGSCTCDYSEEEGYVYKPDPTQFSDNGCYQYESCQKSRLTGVACDTPSQCEDPSVWQYPFAPIPYIEQQWITASRIKGSYNNGTLLQLLDINQDNYEDRIQDALGRKAQDVQRAIASYNGCVCYFPGDNSTYRQGMVVNDRQYVYMQAFASPYLLPVVTDPYYNDIFQGYVYPVGPAMLKYQFTTGSIVEITFPQKYVVISAIRIMASPGGVLIFYDSLGNQICPTVTLQNYDVDFSDPVFNWNGGSGTGSTLGRAMSCGPVYSCVPGKSFPDYENICGIKTDTDQCIAYRENVCEEDGFIYWPVDSLDVYPGCERVADEDTCVCCRRVTPLQLLTDGKLYMRIEAGNPFIAKARFYGYSNSSLVSTPEFKSYVSTGLGYITDCQDQKFYRGVLGADRSYYTFPSISSLNKGNYYKSLDVCSLRGGWMAIGTPSATNTESSIADSSLDILKRECGNIGNGNGLCWVNARSLINEMSAPRSRLFNPLCDLWGCFFSNLFFTNSSSFDYSTSYFDYIHSPNYKQYPATTYIRDVGVPGTDNQISAYTNMDFYAASYCKSSQDCKVLDGQERFTTLEITMVLGFRFTLNFTHNLNLARKNSIWSSGTVSTVAYGTFMNTYQYTQQKVSANGGATTNQGVRIQSIVVSGNSNIRFQKAADQVQCIFSPGDSSTTTQSFDSQSSRVVETTRYGNPTIMGYPNSDNLYRNLDLMVAMYGQWGLKDGTSNVFNNLDYDVNPVLKFLNSVCTMNQIILNLAFEGRDYSYNNCIKSTKCPMVTCNYDPTGSTTNLLATQNLYTDCCYRYSNGYATVANRDFCSKADYSAQSFRNEYCDSSNNNNAYFRLRNMQNYLSQPSSNSIDLHPGCSYNLIDDTYICAGGTKQRIVYADNAPTLGQIFQRGNCIVGVLSVEDEKKNYPVLSSYMSSFIQSRKYNYGQIKYDLTYGFNSKPYMPLFLQGNVLGYTMLTRPPRNPYFYNLMQYKTLLGDVLPPISATPIYLLSPRWVGMFEGVGWVPASNVLNCTQCYITPSNTCYWDQMYYSQVLWMNQFVCPTPDIYVSKSTGAQISTNLPDFPRTKISLFADQSSIQYSSFYIYQTLYIQNYTKNPYPSVQWTVPTCLTVSASGMRLQFCDSDINNIICQYDWTKYAVVSGTQCGPCGCSTRTGGVPIPNLTCGMDNPLANATLYPYDHFILKNYLLGTLGEVARSYNIAPEVFDFQNVSVVMGVPGAWEKWASCFCDRQGFTAFGVNPSLNWVCFCLPTIWPVDCGRQVNAKTNVMKRYCATREEFCNVYLNESAVSGPIMRTQDIPPILRPVDEDLSVIDPTCGPNLQLSSYVIFDRFGGAQTNLNLDVKFTDINSQFVQFQTTARTAMWYNGGKSPIDFTFEWDIPSSVSLYYRLQLCSDCSNALMEVFIYPLNLGYNLPEVYLSYNVSMAKDVLTLVSVEFIVSIIDTGYYMMEGEVFPLRVFKGIGFKFHNIDAGSLITLYNPIVTTNVTRFECENRVTPQWYEPVLRIESRSPDRFCPVRANQITLYPGAVLGECYCGNDRGGAGCDCIKTTSQFGGEVCGGFGDEGKLVLGPDNVYYSTGVGVEAGCFVYTLPSGKKYSDCKNVLLGTYIFTLFVDGAIFDYPSVYVDFVPAKDVPIFRFYEDNVDRETYDQCVVSCASVGMYMPYYQTIDDLSQLLIDTRTRLPIFMGVDTPDSTPTSWPWEKDNVGYFLKDPVLTYMSEEGTCNVLICAVVNFNNYAYLATVTPVSASATYLHDGDTITRNVNAGTYDIVWDPSSELVITFILFGDLSGTDTVSCTGGLCNAFTSNGVVKSSQCRCPGRFASLVIGTSSKISEVQIFNTVDTIRSSSYTYN